MKITTTFLSVLLLLSLYGCGEAEQQNANNDEKADKEKEEEKVDLRFPRLSPRAEVSQNIGITGITIDYSRPYVKDRQIWGDLVPYDEEWRTGADAPTTIKFEHDVSIEGNELEAGKYEVTTIPAEDDDWTFTFNKVDGEDEMNISVEASNTDKHYEMMTFKIHDVTDNSARVTLAWDELKTGFDMEVETHEIVTRLIEKAMDQADEEDWNVYSQSASYLIQREERLDQAEEWLNKSIEIEENWRNLYTKSSLRKAQGNKEEAIEYLERAIETGREQEEEFGAEGFLKSNLEEMKEES